MSEHSLVEAERSLLLVIDIQTRLAAAVPDKPREQLFRHVGMLGQAAQLLEVPVIYTEQYPAGLGHTETEVLEHLPDSKPIEKTCFSCVQADDFIGTLSRHARKQVILCGIETHVCVLQTAFQLMQHGYQVFVVEDAVASRHKHRHKNAIARMRQGGIIITNTESVMFEWMRDARHPQFKTISKLLR